MPRGFKIDRPTTKMMHGNRYLFDRRSKAVLDVNYDSHMLLFGRDKTIQRDKAWASLFGSIGSVGQCDWCGRELYSEVAEMDHKKGGLTGRCDCFHNLQFLCTDCHKSKHNRVPKLGASRKQAVRDFDALYPRGDAA